MVELEFNLWSPDFTVSEGYSQWAYMNRVTTPQTPTTKRLEIMREKIIYQSNTGRAAHSLLLLESPSAQWCIKSPRVPMVKKLVYLFDRRPF